MYVHIDTTFKETWEKQNRLGSIWKLKQRDSTGMLLWPENMTQCKWIELKHSSIMGFHKSLRRSKKKKICSMLSPIWTDRSNLKIPIFSIRTTGEKYYASRQRSEKRKDEIISIWNRGLHGQIYPVGSQKKTHSFVTCTVEIITNFAQTNIKSFMNLKSPECRKSFLKKLIFQSLIEEWNFN